MAAQKPTAKVKTAEWGDTNPTEQRGEDEEIIMAEDARISAALSAHPKTRKLRKRLGVPGCWSLVPVSVGHSHNDETVRRCGHR